MAPPHQNSLEDARRLLANCILIRGLQKTGASDAPRNDAMFRTWLFVGIHSECAGQYSDANGSVPAQSKLAPRLISGRYRSIDIGNHSVDVLAREPMKVVHALRNTHHDRHSVTSRTPLKRENGPPSTKRDPRPNARVPAEQDDIRRIRTLHAIQIPWICDNDAQAHRSRTLPQKGSCDGGKCEHDRAVGHVIGNELLDDH